MTPISFGPSQRRLFGLFHAPDERRKTGRAVLLCHPFGHETLRIHRFYRLLAERLARQGTAVLRFDYHATGDSPGDDEQGELDGWATDIQQAHQELLRRSGATHVSWFGVRLGGSLALLAAPQASPPVQALVLWDAVFDGPTYLAELQHAHLDEMELSHCIPDTDWRRSVERDPMAFADECLGFAISPKLRSQILALEKTLAGLPAAPRISLFATAENAGALRWVTAMRQAHPTANLRYVEFTHPLIWTSNPYANNEMVPAQALQTMMETLHGDS